ncbi:2-hydroxyacid dehydrogenase [Arthrobacter sp. CAN_A1]|uniref:2-hydroxyacid dehydrogenase n=1 Tax=Arthrobacter sp. CAN_A1 TaxID=2787717 RepID=UPI0018C95685
MDKITTVSVPSVEMFDALQPAPAGISLVVWDFDEGPVGAELADIDAAVLPYMSSPDQFADAVRSAPNLRLVQTQSTGYEGIPELVGDDVAVVSAAGVHAAATAELAIGLAIASLRGIDDAVRNQTLGQWKPARYQGLADRKVLLVGVGGIGVEIARRLAPFEVELTRVGSSARDDEWGHVHGTDELVALAGQAEVLIAITPLTDSTRGLINAEVLAAMPDGALVVNVARGAVVDSEALTAEVVSGRLSAALDVFDPEPVPEGHPLWSASGALITPHSGGNTGAFWPRIIKLLKRQLDCLATGKEPENLVQRGSLFS